MPPTHLESLARDEFYMLRFCLILFLFCTCNALIVARPLTSSTIDEIDRNIKGKLIGSVSPSLEMKESVDFLITTALQVQEILREARSHDYFISGLQKGALQHAAVAFDAEIELMFPTSSAWTELFARYWIYPERYVISIVWAEPHGRQLQFSVYPPSLRVSSDKLVFSLCHDVYPIYNETHHKPIRYSPRFSNFFGDFPISNIRFAEAEPTNLASQADDLYRGFRSGSQSLRISSVRIESSNEVSQVGTFAKIDAFTCLQSIRFFNRTNRLLKEVKYEYEFATNAIKLMEKTIFTPVGSISLVLPGNGATVRIHTNVISVKEVVGTAKEGGRTLRMELSEADIGGVKMRLPTALFEFLPTNSVPVRIATLTKHRLLDGETDLPECAAVSYGGFSPRDHLYRFLLTKYWQVSPEAIDTSDRAVIRRLLSFYSQQATPEPLGMRLKQLNILMELSRMIGDVNSLSRWYQRYLNVLIVHQKSSLVLLGGYNAIDTLVLWGRFSEADTLLRHWINAVRAICNVDEIKRFAQTEFKKGTYWAVIQLLGELAQDTPDDLRFELSAARTLALAELQRVLEAGERRDRLLMAQAEWVRSSKIDLGLLTFESRKEALRLSALAGSLAAEQEQLLRRVRDLN